jgi:hypothetical protein
MDEKFIAHPQARKFGFSDGRNGRNKVRPLSPVSWDIALGQIRLCSILRFPSPSDEN